MPEWNGQVDPIVIAHAVMNAALGPQGIDPIAWPCSAVADIQDEIPVVLGKTQCMTRLERCNLFRFERRVELVTMRACTEQLEPRVPAPLLFHFSQDFFREAHLMGTREYRDHCNPTIGSESSSNMSTSLSILAEMISPQSRRTSVRAYARIFAVGPN